MRGQGNNFLSLSLSFSFSYITSTSFRLPALPKGAKNRATETRMVVSFMSSATEEMEKIFV